MAEEAHGVSPKNEVVQEPGSDPSAQDQDAPEERGPVIGDMSNADGLVTEGTATLKRGRGETETDDEEEEHRSQKKKAGVSGEADDKEEDANSWKEEADATKDTEDHADKDGASKNDDGKKDAASNEGTIKDDTVNSNPFFAFGMSLAPTKEYVCPFNKLLESKKPEGFLIPQAGNPSSFNALDVAEAAEEATAEPLPKSFEINDSIMEDERMLFENKACTLAYYRDEEWNTPVPVVLKLLEKKTKESKRILCYQVGTGRLQLNTVILPSMSIRPLKTKSVIFSGQLIADETKLLPHRIIFQDPVAREEFMKHF